MPKMLDLTNQQYGDLIVLRRAEKQKNDTCWVCICLKCSDNTEVIIKTEYLRQYKNPNCGNHRKDEFSYRKYNINDSYFSIPNEENSYWAGFLAADGYIADRSNCAKSKNNKTLNLELSIKDLEHIELFKNTLKYEGILRKRNRSNGIVVLQVSSRQIIENLETIYNITPKKSFTLKPPTMLSTELQECFLIGLIDGDGCIHLTKKGILDFTLTSASIDVVLWVNNIINRILNTNMKYYYIYDKSKAIRIRISNKKAEKFLGYIKKYNVPFLKRKWDKVQKLGV